MPTRNPDFFANPEQADSGPLLASGSSSPDGTSSPKATDRTRLNAYRHGLTGQIMVLLPEEQQAYNDHCSSLRAAWTPIGAIEENLVQSICDAQWRLKRAVSLENSMFAMSAEPWTSQTGNPEVDVAFGAARTWIKHAKDLSLLSVYENRLHRRMEKDVAELKSVQAKRIAGHDAAMKIAKALYRQAKSQGNPYNPEAYFKVHPQTPESVFSTPAVVHEIARSELFQSAQIGAEKENA